MNISAKQIEKIIAENARRVDASRQPAYDPLTGNPSDPNRVGMMLTVAGGKVFIPRQMVDDPAFRRISGPADYKALRMRYDFEFWAAACVRIRHKMSGQTVPFVLNAPQRRVAAMLEADRLAGRPLRLIMLKARQWGGSTLIQMYFAWIQIVLQRNWNSLICAHVKDTSATIRGMYDSMLANYPEELWMEDEKPRLACWQRSANTLEIAGRGGRITISSSFGQDSARGLDFSMVHMSEVAFWKATDSKSPEDFVRTVCGSVPMVPLSAIVMESTANGVGNYFHSQWLRSEQGRTSYRPVFVAWHDIELYTLHCPDPEAFISRWGSYERGLWDSGLTLDRIYWWSCKRGEFPSDEGMFAEYPTTAEEAFKYSGHNVFDAVDVERLRPDCADPIRLSVDDCPAYCSEILDTPPGDGELKVWQLPPRGCGADDMPSDRFVVAVDVGGRWRHADYSVIAVMDRCPEGSDRDGPAVVAQWRGHCDHDLLARYAEVLARAYGHALLVIESNTLESSGEGHSQFIIEDLNTRYDNLYVRHSRDRTDGGYAEKRIGFHTNRSTKAAIIANMVAAVRRGSYIERDHEALNEMQAYELTDSGGYAARPGYHDDILMTRAIALYVVSSMDKPEPPDPSLRELIDSYAVSPFAGFGHNISF